MMKVHSITLARLKACRAVDFIRKDEVTVVPALGGVLELEADDRVPQNEIAEKLAVLIENGFFHGE